MCYSEYRDKKGWPEKRFRKAWWLYLKPGWVEPDDSSHTIHECTLKEVAAKLSRVVRETTKNPARTRSNPASKSILKRIDLANKWIAFAQKHDIWGIDPYMSASSNGVIFYTHKITVSAQKNRATFKYTDGYGQFKKKESETYNLNNTDTYSDTGVSALRYAINSLIIKPINSLIIKPIKRGAKDEGVTIPASLR